MPHHRLAYLPKDLKRPIQIRVQHQHRRHILAPIAIIRRRPHRHEVRSREHILEALLHHLMRAADQLQAVRLRELVHRALAEHEPRTAGRLAETVHVVGVRPDQVGEGAGGGDFFGARDGANLGITEIGGSISYLVDCVDGGRKTPVDAENAVVDELWERGGEELTAATPR